MHLCTVPIGSRYRAQCRPGSELDKRVLLLLLLLPSFIFCVRTNAERLLDLKRTHSDFCSGVAKRFTSLSRERTSLTLSIRVRCEYIFFSFEKIRARICKIKSNFCSVLPRYCCAARVEEKKTSDNRKYAVAKNHGDSFRELQKYLVACWHIVIILNRIEDSARRI